MALLSKSKSTAGQVSTGRSFSRLGQDQGQFRRRWHAAAVDLLLTPETNVLSIPISLFGAVEPLTPHPPAYTHTHTPPTYIPLASTEEQGTTDVVTTTTGWLGHRLMAKLMLTLASNHGFLPF